MTVTHSTFETLKNIAIFVGVLFILSIGSYLGFTGWHEIQASKRDRQLILEGVSKVNKKIVLQKLVADKLNNLPIETFTFSVCFDNGICHKLYINGKLNPVVIMYENDYKDKLEKFLDSINVVEIKKYINTIK